MQRDRGLAGSGTALDHQDPRPLGPDDPVLLGLDGFDDVAHPTRPRGVQCGQQSRLAGQTGAAECGQGRIVGLESGDVQIFVGDGLDDPPADPQVAPAPHAERCGRCRHVERPGRWGAPVHQQLFPHITFREDAHPADVHVLTVGSVQPAETQLVLRDIEIDERLTVSGVGDIALYPATRGAVAVAEITVAEPGRLLAHPIQPLVQHGDESLLVGDSFHLGHAIHLRR